MKRENCTHLRYRSVYLGLAKQQPKRGPARQWLQRNSRGRLMMLTWDWEVYSSIGQHTQPLHFQQLRSASLLRRLRSTTLGIPPSKVPSLNCLEQHPKGLCAPLMMRLRSGSLVFDALFCGGSMYVAVGCIPKNGQKPTPSYFVSPSR